MADIDAAVRQARNRIVIGLKNESVGVDEIPLAWSSSVGERLEESARIRPVDTPNGLANHP